MRQTLLALICLSTFALAQNVLAIAPSVESGPGAAKLSMTIAHVAHAGFVSNPAGSSQEAAPMSAMALLLVGLSGLTIAGGRRHDRSRKTA